MFDSFAEIAHAPAHDRNGLSRTSVSQAFCQRAERACWSQPWMFSPAGQA